MEMKIDFVLSGKLAERIDYYVTSGYFATKPEIVRQALRVLVRQIERQELHRTILERMKEEAA